MAANDWLNCNLTELRELYADRVRDLEHEYQRANTAEVEVERLNSWDGMMSVLDAHYPAAVFNGSSGDDGPRIIVMLRIIDGLRLEVAQLHAALEAENGLPNE